MPCTQPCSCCKGACCTAGVCEQKTCADCEPAGEYQGPGTSCDPNPCAIPCDDCYKDCVATNGGDPITASCAGGPGGDPGVFWERTDSGVDYKIYLYVGQTFGYPSLNCYDSYMASTAHDSVTGARRTYIYPDIAVAFSADGCIESITPGSPVQGDADVCSVIGAWAGCDNGSDDCDNVTPDTPGSIEFSCDKITCTGDGDCPPGIGTGYCIDGFCEPDAPP